jgi:hypothetical protein
MAGGLFRRRRGSRDPFADVERPPIPASDAWDEEDPAVIRAGLQPVDIDAVDDAWDDEWQDPAFRRPSIPAAMDIGPAQVDAWLEGQARELDDVTRDNAARWSDDPDALRGQRGATWDDDTPTAGVSASPGAVDGTIAPTADASDRATLDASPLTSPDAGATHEALTDELPLTHPEADASTGPGTELALVPADEPTQLPVDPGVARARGLDGLDDTTAESPEPTEAGAPTEPTEPTEAGAPTEPTEPTEPTDHPEPSQTTEAGAPSQTVVDLRHGAGIPAADTTPDSAADSKIVTVPTEDPAAGPHDDPHDDPHDVNTALRSERAPDPLELTVARPTRTDGSDDPVARRRGERVVIVRPDDAVMPGASWDDETANRLPGAVASHLDETDGWGADRRAAVADRADDLDVDDRAGYLDDAGTGTGDVESFEEGVDSFDDGDEGDEPEDVPVAVGAGSRVARDAQDHGIDDLPGSRGLSHFIQVAVSAGWLIAVIAAARTVLAVGAAANNGDDQLSAWQRFGTEFAQLGTTQALLLVTAVILLGMAALGGVRSIDRHLPRSTSGLGMVGAAAAIGILGGLLTFLTSRDLGAPTLSAVIDLVGAVGLSFTALLTALVTLRSQRPA